MKYAVPLLLLLTACVHNPPKINSKYTVEFKNVRDGVCIIKNVEIDAKTGHQIVICE